MPASADVPISPRIRPAAASDRPFLLEVLRLSALATYPDLAQRGRLSLRDQLEASYADAAGPEGRSWIAEDATGLPAAGLVAMRAVHPVLEEPELLIVAIATTPEHRGRGFARALLEHAGEAARRDGARALRLFANPANRSAMTLYRSQSFTSLSVELRKPLS